MTRLIQRLLASQPSRRALIAVAVSALLVVQSALVYVTVQRLEERALRVSTVNPSPQATPSPRQRATAPLRVAAVPSPPVVAPLAERDAEALSVTEVPNGDAGAAEAGSGGAGRSRARPASAGASGGPAGGPSGGPATADPPPTPAASQPAPSGQETPTCRAHPGHGDDDTRHGGREEPGHANECLPEPERRPDDRPPSDPPDGRR